MDLNPPPGFFGLEARNSWVDRSRRPDHPITVLWQLVGAAGGSGGAPALPNAREEEVLDSGACALSVERSVDV